MCDECNHVPIVWSSGRHLASRLSSPADTPPHPPHALGVARSGRHPAGGVAPDHGHQSPALCHGSAPRMVQPSPFNPWGEGAPGHSAAATLGTGPDQADPRPPPLAPMPPKPEGAPLPPPPPGEVLHLYRWVPVALALPGGLVLPPPDRWLEGTDRGGKVPSLYMCGFGLPANSRKKNPERILENTMLCWFRCYYPQPRFCG